MPLPSVQYQYTERKQAKVSSDFHIRFDNAYYSVDKAYLHQYVFVNATTTTVKIYSKTGDFICEWPRATRRGEWKTNQAHLPENSGNYSEWNASYFISLAMTVGPNTVELIKAILASRKYEVQTYWLCVGVLNYKKSYSKVIVGSRTQFGFWGQAPDNRISRLRTNPLHIGFGSTNPIKSGISVHLSTCRTGGFSYIGLTNLASVNCNKFNKIIHLLIQSTRDLSKIRRSI